MSERSTFWVRTHDRYLRCKYSSMVTQARLLCLNVFFSCSLPLVTRLSKERNASSHLGCTAQGCQSKLVLFPVSHHHIYPVCVVTATYGGGRHDYCRFCPGKIVRVSNFSLLIYRKGVTPPFSASMSLTSASSVFSHSSLSCRQGLFIVFIYSCIHLISPGLCRQAEKRDGAVWKPSTVPRRGGRGEGEATGIWWNHHQGQSKGQEGEELRGHTDDTFNMWMKNSSGVVWS